MLGLALFRRRRVAVVDSAEVLVGLFLQKGGSVFFHDYTASRGRDLFFGDEYLCFLSVVRLDPESGGGGLRPAGGAFPYKDCLYGPARRF